MKSLTASIQHDNMKERITFIVSHPSHTHPDNFITSSDSLKIKSLPHTAREDRLTFDINTLPQPLKHLLQNVEQGHLRWSSGRFYDAATPYAARVPAGLHILTSPGRLQSTDFFLEKEEGNEKGFFEERFDDPFLSAAWGISGWRELRVVRPFRIGPWEWTFYSPVQEITPFRDFLERVLDGQEGVSRADNLEWMKRLDRLQDADYVDVKYDAISHKVEASVYWGPSEIDRSGYLVGKDVEVGIMGVDKALEAEDIKLAGYIYEIGESDHLEATMFSFPSRHHKAPSTFTLTTSTPTGFHPTLHLSLSGSLTPPREDGDCTLNAYFTLPPSLFVDKYQLSSTNANLLRQLNIRRLRDVTGNTDLEAPEYKIQDWGSRVLIEIDTEGNHQAGLDVELPLHLRYLRPAVNASSTEVTFAWPSVFWACKSDSWRKMSNSPFDRTALGWEDLFPEQVMYYHLSPVPGEHAPVDNGTWGRIQTPVLDKGSRNEEIIKTWTVLVVGAGFVWIVGAVLWAKIVSGGTKAKKEEAVKKRQ